MKARTASRILIVVGLAVMAFAILVHPPPGAVPARYASVPGMRMLFEGGMTLPLSILGIGAAVLALGVVMLLRAGSLDTAWSRPLK